MIVYHGTREENIDSILREGLRKSKPGVSTYGEAVYGTRNYKRAKYFIGGDGTVFSFEIDDNEVKTYSFYELLAMTEKAECDYYLKDNLAQLCGARVICITYGNKSNEVVIYDTNLIKNLKLESEPEVKYV